MSLSGRITESAFKHTSTSRYLFTKEKSLRLAFLLLACALIILVVSLRLGGLSGTPGKLLWAEDGHVFLKGAIEHGLASLMEPYAGYLHVYARAVALIASLFGPRLIPFMMLGGWLVGYVVANLFVIRALRLNGAGALVALGTVLICALTPTTGETLFTVTNVQWYMGAALAVVVLMPSARSPSLAETIFIAVASLTGPFSIILLPLLILRIVIFRDAYVRQRADLALVVCAFVQLSFFVASDRLDAQTSTHLDAWGNAFFAFLTFGTQGIIAYLAVAVFWVVYAGSMLGRLVARGSGDYALKSSLLFLIASIFFLLAGLYAVRQDPGVATPLGAHARYFVIPYFLLVVSAFLVCGRKAWVGAVMCAALLVLAFQGFRTVDRFDYDYDSFVDFTTVHDGVFIPINPSFEGSQFGYRPRTGGESKGEDVALVVGADKVSRGDNGRWLLSGSSIGCKLGTRTLGLELVLNTSADGVLRAGWDGDVMRQRYSVRNGVDTAYVALPWRDSGVLDFAVEAAGHGNIDFGITSINAYCVPAVRR
ncbi:hypothetical protein [Xanthomonas sacchari]|uniref:hypothetical protein n=1 Tax=Xanthomonas sacchari TaxID=56458 RepID=UPI00225E2E70|nr:hypothetical protein [Xanthomonas sacchari]MCW0435425.1 hypothetical protein [Xanthomonas sacchari]